MSTEEARAVFESTSPDATKALGHGLGESLVGGIVIGLVGPLGAGKTQLVKGVAVGNALKDERAVTSPTFTLIHEYPGKLTLCHLDAYRLASAAELLALGFDELQRVDSAVIVEWADRVPGAMPDEMMWIDIASTGDTDRSLTVRAFGETAIACLKAWQAAVR